MEQETNLEQPTPTDFVQPAMAEDIKNEGTENRVVEGSILNKFKTTESLVEAYENLQAEFTRKSQKLSEVSKELAKLKENANKTTAPFYLSEQFEKTLNEFFQNNPSAKEYASEISEFILKDKALQNSNEPLELAWAKVLNHKFSNLEETLEKDEKLLERILSHKNVSERMIKNYLQSLKDNKTAPMISTHTGASFSLAPKNKPNSLAEAKILAEALFKI